MIHYGQVDGIPTVYTEDGPVGAGLVFRVGIADEPLSQRGITHLIEHLALHGLGVTDYHFNGTTGQTFTNFLTRGTPESVTVFLQQVAVGLKNLPMDRLEIEKGVLRSEADGRSSGVYERMLFWRYGAQGRGLLEYRELGLNWLGRDELQQWAQTFFTRENAVLWFTGMTPPADLHLDLPSGQRKPLPAMPEALPETPSYAVESSKLLGYHGIVKRSTAATVLVSVLHREMFRRLRQETGFCYTPVVDYVPVDADHAEIVAVLDPAPDQRAAALSEFVDLIAQLRWGTVDSEALDEVKAMITRAQSEDGVEAGRTPAVAMDLLMGTTSPTIEDVRAEVATITAADIRAAAAELADSAFLLVTEETAADWAGFVQAPLTSPDVMRGEGLPAINNPDLSLIVSDEGVSLVASDGAATVAFAECAAVLKWPDGGRTLIGTDGMGLALEPTLFPLTDEHRATIERHVPPHLVVPMPHRSAEQIPSPPGEPYDVVRRRGRRLAWLMIAAWTLVGLGVLSLVISVGGSLWMNAAPDDFRTQQIIRGAMWFVGIVFAAGFYPLIQNLRRW